MVILGSNTFFCCRSYIGYRLGKMEENYSLSRQTKTYRKIRSTNDKIWDTGDFHRHHFLQSIQGIWLGRWNGGDESQGIYSCRALWKKPKIWLRGFIDWSIWKKALDAMNTFLDNEILIGIIMIISCVLLWLAWSWWTNLTMRKT